MSYADPYEGRLAAPRSRDRRDGILGLYDGITNGLERATADWFTGFALRFAFASVLMVYYMHSAWGSLDGSLLNLFSPSDGAYATMLPPIAEAAGYDKSEIATFPWYFVVLAGTWGELILPVLVVIGLFTRIAAAGMIVVVFVQSYVDIAFHGLEEKSIGAMFDRLSDAVILDQRLLWVTILVLLVVNGAGALSLDRLLAGRR